MPFPANIPGNWVRNHDNASWTTPDGTVVGDDELRGGTVHLDPNDNPVSLDDSGGYYWRALSGTLRYETNHPANQGGAAVPQEDSTTSIEDDCTISVGAPPHGSWRGQWQQMRGTSDPVFQLHRSSDAPDAPPRDDNTKPKGSTYPAMIATYIGEITEKGKRYTRYLYRLSRPITWEGREWGFVLVRGADASFAPNKHVVLPCTKTGRSKAKTSYFQFKPTFKHKVPKPNEVLQALKWHVKGGKHGLGLNVVRDREYRPNVDMPF